MEDVYKRNGYKNRDDYLKDLAANYGVDEETVYSLAEVLGETEDFDGLVVELEDMV